MTHPHVRDITALEATEDSNRFVDDELSRAILTLVGCFDRASQVMRHQLLAVADAKRGQSEVEQSGIALGRVWSVHAVRPSAEDERLRFGGANCVGTNRSREDFAVYLALSHATRDELCVLG